MDTGEYEDDFEPPEPILPPLPRYSSMTYNLDCYDEEGSSNSGNQDRITGFLNDMLDQSISDLIKEDEVLGKFEDNEISVDYHKMCAKTECGITVGAKLKENVKGRDLGLLNLTDEQIQKKTEATLDDLKANSSKRKASKKKPKLPKDVNAVNIKPGTKFNPVQLKPALMEDSENLRMDVLVKEYRRVHVMEYINHVGVTREDPDTNSQEVNLSTIQSPSSLLGSSSNTSKLDLPDTSVNEGNNTKMDETKAEKEMCETRAGKEMDKTQTESGVDDTQVEKEMDETQTEKEMDETQAEKKMDETQTEKKMDETQAEKKMDETQTEKKMDETQTEEEMVETAESKRGTPSAQKTEADVSVHSAALVNAEEFELPQANNKEIADEEGTVRVSRTILDKLLGRKKKIKSPQTENQKQNVLPKLNILNCFKTQENNEDEINANTTETPNLKTKRGFISRCLTFFRKRRGRVQPSNIG